MTLLEAAVLWVAIPVGAIAWTALLMGGYLAVCYLLGRNPTR
jgi:hypothetical protein